VEALPVLFLSQPPLITRLLNSHARRNWSTTAGMVYGGGRHLGVVELLVGAVSVGRMTRARADVALETFIKVGHTLNGGSDGEDDEDDGQYGKGGQHLGGGLVLFLFDARCPDAHELVDKVGKASKIDNYDKNLSMMQNLTKTQHSTSNTRTLLCKQM